MRTAFRVWALATQLALAGNATAASAAMAPEKAALDVVVVSATRLQRAAVDVPASVDVREIRRDTLGVNLSESLSGGAGLVARDRQNYAQDTQISIRGFAARSTCSIRAR